MASISANQNISLPDGLAGWLVVNSDFNSDEPSYIAKIKYHLIGKVVLVGASLFFLIEKIGRTVLGCCMAHVGQLITLGYWQGARVFGLDQMQKGAFAGSISLCCFRSICSPERFANSLKPIIREMRESKIRTGSSVIAEKLRAQLKRAQEQANAEPNKKFEYSKAPEGCRSQIFPDDVPTSYKIDGYEVGVSSCQGFRREMEDEWLTAHFSLKVGRSTYPVQVFGIFDGHGGKEASCYVKKHLTEKLRETLEKFCAHELTDEVIWNALKITFVELNKGFNKPTSGTTAAVAIILDQKLWIANAGDSRIILDNGTQLSEDAKLGDPRYQRSVYKRGGVVENDRIAFVGYENGLLQCYRLNVARAVGDHEFGPYAISARPKITVLPLSKIEKGCHLILACDGIYDVSSTKQIAEAVKGNHETEVGQLAKNIAYSALQAGSTDNLTVMIVKL